MKGKVTTKEEYAQMIARREQLRTCINALSKKPGIQKPKDLVHALIVALEEKAAFPEAHYALAGRLLTPELARVIESYGKHWVGQLEGTCPIQWEGPWRRLMDVANQLRQDAPQSFREGTIYNVDETSRVFYIFTRSVRINDYGRRRIVIAYESAELVGTPLFLFTDALYWEGRRIVQMWQYRWDEHFFRNPGMASE